MLAEKVQRKYRALVGGIRPLGRAAVCFSGGVDSSLLLAAAVEALGSEVLALIGSSAAVPASEVEAAARFCKERGIEHVVVRTHEFDIAGFDRNPENRCYLCKQELFSRFEDVADEHGIVWLLEGSNMDDMGDYRPGAQAVAEDERVRSPLQEAALAKDEIRSIARELGLPTWDKPSAACLNSRFEFGDLITAQSLSMVEQAEDYLKSLGFAQVRVRMKGTTARIELLEDDIGRIVEPRLRREVDAKLKGLGFRYVAVDLQGYRTGSLNPVAESTRAGA